MSVDSTGSILPALNGQNRLAENQCRSIRHGQAVTLSVLVNQDICKEYFQ